MPSPVFPSSVRRGRQIAQSGQYLRVLGFLNGTVTDFTGAKFDFAEVSENAHPYVFYVDTGNSSEINGLEKASSQSGYLTQYQFTAAGDSGYLGIQKKATEQSKALSEGFLGGIALLGLGSDLITDNGIRSAASSVARSGGTGEAFAALGGGKLKHKTGSHVEMSKKGKTWFCLFRFP